MTETNRRPLHGLRVLDFSTTIAGPHCSRLLADMGADVIKVESPEGDLMRSRPVQRDGAGTMFGQLNAGKKSIVLDLKRPEAIAAVKKLVAKVWVNWRSSIWVGIFSVLGSAGWALAMTLENAALVRAVGQIELVFTFISSRLVLKERPSLGEWIGSFLVIGGVVLILVTR